MDNLQMAYNGTWAPVHGGSGGTPYEPIILSTGEHIIKVDAVRTTIYEGVNFVAGFVITTNKGRTVALGSTNGNPVTATPCPTGGYGGMRQIQCISFRSVWRDSSQPACCQHGKRGAMDTGCGAIHICRHMEVDMPT